MKNLILVLFGLLLIGTAVQGQDYDVDAYIEMLRSDVKTEKIAIITEVMDFTEEESSAFWPMYREYELDFSKLGDQRIALIKDYAAHYNEMTDEKAKELISTSIKLQEKRLSLQKKYFKSFQKILPTIKAAKLIQLENQINLLIDLQIAAELPLIKEAHE
jgi:hypothetical protein